MTIAVATTAPDGIVLAADSRTILRRDRVGHRVASDHSTKIFTPFPGIGVVTYGTAFVGNATIAGLIERFAREMASDNNGGRPNPRDAAELLAEFFGKRIEQEAQAFRRRPPAGVLGFLLAGYDLRGSGQVFDILIPGTDQREPYRELRADAQQQTAVSRGRTRYIRRMIDAWDNQSREYLKTQFGIIENEEKARAVEFEYEEKFGMRLNTPVSLQDALDFATFMVRTTIDMERFTDGYREGRGDVPICGGEVQALIVGRSGAEWVLRPTIKVRGSGVGEAG